MLTIRLGISVPSAGIELVIPHHRQRRAGIEHFPDDADRRQLPGPAVDEVADKDRCAVRMAPSAKVVPVSHSAEQCSELVGVAVDVPDNVVSHGVAFASSLHYTTNYKLLRSALQLSMPKSAPTPIDIRATSQIHPMPFTRIELAIMSIVDGGLAILLGKRAGAPHKGKWALPGGVLRIDKDRDLDTAAQRVAHERLGVTLPYFRQLQAVGAKNRDSRAPWALSIAYRALVPVEALRPTPGKRLDEIKWRPIDEAAADSGLAFDHASLIQSAAEATRDEIERLELPFGFLPERFTLGELQACCEALLGRALDKSSFRRRIDERDLLEVVPGEMRTGAFRPAQLYRASK